MSRYTKHLESGKSLEYGFDKVPNPGYFVDLYNEKNELVKGGDTRELMCLKGQEHMNRLEIAEMLEDYGASEDHVNAVVMDKPF